MNTGESILLTEENLWFFVLPLKNVVSNVQFRKGASRTPVLLSKSGVRSSHDSSSLGRRIQSAHLLCNFHKRKEKGEKKKKKKKERTHCTAPISKTSLTLHFFSYDPCTLGHKHGGNSWVEGCDFSLFFSFASTLVSILPPFSPCPISYPKNRSLSLLSSPRTFHALEIPKTHHSLLIEQHPSFLLKILLYLTYFSHRLIHSFFFLLRISYFQFIFCYTPFAVYGQCYFPFSA